MNIKLVTTALALAVGASALYAAEDLVLKHRYSFEEAFDEQGNYYPKDSVGGADGTYFNATPAEWYDMETGEFYTWYAELTGAGTPASLTDGSFISLPANIISSFNSFSIEMWVNCTKDNGNWMRIYDFGSANITVDETTGEERIAGGKNYTFLTWRSYDGTLRSGIRLDGDERMVDAPVLPIGDDVFHHIVYTYDGENQVGRIYRDGVLSSEAAQAFNPTQLGDMPNMWLGKSNWTDPYFCGRYAEFRIYQGVLPSPQIANNYKLGPNELGDVGTLESIEFTAAKDTIYVNERLPLGLVGNFSKAGKISIGAEAKVTSLNPAAVDAVSGMIARGIKPGTATLKATYLDKEATFEVTVTDAIPEMTLRHRYSFSGNANDSVGGANGTLEGGATVSGGKLVLAPADKAHVSAQYVKLPDGMLSPYMSTTIETWVQSDNVSDDFNWTYVWAFANVEGNAAIYHHCLNARNGGSKLMQTPLYTLYSQATAVGNSEIAALAEGKEAHVVVVADGINKTLSFYRDGNLITTVESDGAPMDMGVTTNNFIGLSPWAADPGFYGKVNELRIWEGAATLEDIRLSFASGPDTLPSEQGDLKAVRIVPRENKTSIVESAKLPFSVYADYQNVSGVILDIADVVVLSSDDSIVGVEGSSLLGVGVGTATVSATYEGVTGEIGITVTALPPATLTHRYSFDTDASDSVGSAHGTLFGTAEIVDGTVRINGDGFSSGDADTDPMVPYVQLPANLISECESVTLETWINVDKLATWARIFDFGEKSGSAGTRYMFLAPRNGTVGGTSANFVTAGQGAAEQSVYTSGYYMPTGKMVHVVVTLLADADLGRIYVDGIKVAEVEGITNNPKTIGNMPYCYLGRAMYASDPILVASIDEFRTWNGALKPMEVALHTAIGASTPTIGDLGEFKGITIVPSVPVGAPGTTVTFQVLADYDNVKSVPFNTIDDVQISIDNPAFTLLNNYSYTATVAASGNLIVEYMGTTYSTTIAMGETPAEVVHRYSFNGDASDSVGSVDGENWGLEIADGQLIMDGATPIYLPAGVLDAVAGEAFSFESWMDIPEEIAGDWGSFNISFYDESDGSTYNSFAIGLQPNKGGSSQNNSTWALIELPAVEGTSYAYYKTECFGPKGFPGAGKTHVVYVVNPESQLLRIYINGAYENQVSMTIPAERLAQYLPNYVGVLGCSRAGKGLPGKMDEFRIWRGAMTTAQIAASYAAGPDTLANAATAPKSIALETPVDVITGSATTLNVYANYSNVENVLVTTASDVIVTSSDETIAMIDSKKRIVGVAPGKVTITAKWEGSVLESAKEVTIVEEQIGLLHRYSFNENANDSCGVADVTLNGNAALVNGQLVLDGTRQTFAQLPAGVVSGLKSMTWEIWFTPGTYIGNWNRLLDFGEAGSGGDQNGYLFASIYTGDPNIRIATRAPNNSVGEEYVSVVTGKVMQDFEGQVLHLVVAYDENGAVTGYINGAPVTCTGSNSRALSLIPDQRNYIGRSAFIGDPKIAVSVDEFRIWNGLLDPARVAMNYAAGPNEIPDPSLDILESITASVAVSSLYIGEGLDISVIGHYSKSGDRNIIAETDFVSSDESVVSVANGRILATGAGEAIITATCESKTSEFAVKVSDQVYALAHRYSFENGMTDSVGAADGKTYGDAVVANGMLTLSGNGDRGSLTDGSFAALPDNIMSTWASFSIETWARASKDVGNWTRLYDFGNCFLNGEGRIDGGNNYTMMSWKSGNGDALRSGDRVNGVEHAFNGPVMPIGDGIFRHVVYTYDSGIQTGTIYVDGAKISSGSQAFNPTQFGDMSNMWIGKANFQDPYFAGDIDEFRIWRGVITPAQVAADFKAGSAEIGVVTSVTELKVNTTTPAILNGGLITATATATYEDGTVVDATDDATYSTGDASILAIIGTGRAQGISGGTTTLDVSFGGKTTSVVVTVDNDSFKLNHRYSFNDGAADSIGDAHGTVYGDATVENGILTLTGNGDRGSLTDGSFVALPGNIMTCSSFSIELWATAGEGNEGWGRAFDFGNCTLDSENRIATGAEYYMLAWRNGVLSDKINGTETQVKAEFPANGDGIFHHVVCAYDAAAQIGSIYIDGKLAASGHQVGDPTTYKNGMPNMWIGKSNWPDPYFTGSFEEFRIYDGALSLEQVEKNYAAGPDVIPGPGTTSLDWSVEGDILTISWTEGTLEISDVADGGWIPVDQTSPLVIDLKETEGQVFYRLVK